MPRYVYLTEADNRLLLDLEHPLIAEELHTALERVSEEDTIHLQEMYPDFDNLWLQDEQNNNYIAEFVIPLIRKQSAASKTAVFHSKVHPISKRERSISPGGDWVYLKLYAPYERHDELIANQLRTLVQECRERNIIHQWFFIRYGDPEPHIRLRLHTGGEIHRQDLLLTTLLWARQLTEFGFLQRFSLDTYEREIERYGGPAGIEIFEQVFAIDSEVISLLVAEQYTRHIAIDPLICAVFSLDYFFEAWGLSFRDRLLWIQGITDKHEMSKDFRENRRLLCELLAPWDHTYDPTVMMQRERMNAHLSLFKDHLPALASQIRNLSTEEKLWGTEHDILKSLAHMHINRLLGVNRLNEQKVYAFWRHTLESIERRPKYKQSRENC